MQFLKAELYLIMLNLMKSNTSLRSARVKAAVAAVALVAATLTVNQPTEARGGGGGRGGGGFRGGGERYSGFGGDGASGWAGWGAGIRSERPGEYDGGRYAGFGGDGGGYGGGRGDGDRGRNFDDTPHVSESELRSAANHTYGADRLSTDGGFGRVSNFDAAGSGVGGGLGHDLTQTHPMAQAALVDHGSSVRNAWNNTNHPNFDRAWWDRHNDWWGYDGWGYGWWGGVGWGDLAPYWGMSGTADPVEYDYGNNITYQGDQVYYGTTPEATTTEYYQQAQTLANSAPVIPTVVSNGKTKVSGDWKPLGVFSLNQSGDSTSNTIFQLAVNKQGTVSGNYYNTINNQSSPIHGKVDKKNMRVCFTVGKNKSVVYDTGLANLLEAQSTILVHLSKDKTQQELLTRLNAPTGTDSKTLPAGSSSKS